MKLDLVLGNKYRVANRNNTYQGTLAGIELCRIPLVNRITRFKYRSLVLTEEDDGRGTPTSVRIWGPWYLIEPVTD